MSEDELVFAAVALGTRRSRRVRTGRRRSRHRSRRAGRAASRALSLVMRGAVVSCCRRRRLTR
jgi:hypothetical protein